jgi:hypothetical protein
VTVELALLISSDGIALAHRQAAGHWAILKDASFSDPGLDKAMKGLRKEAEARAGGNVDCLLILPDDQILYTSLTAPTGDPEMTAYRIEEGLEGMTPYAVSELFYDWRAIEADRVKLAVVARETLDEARGFVEGHGFKSAGFAAMPPQERFPGVPLFDLSGDAGVTFSDDGIAFGPDTFGQDPAETEDDTDPKAEADAGAPGADADAADAPETDETPDIASDKTVPVEATDAADETVDDGAPDLTEDRTDDAEPGGEDAADRKDGTTFFDEASTATPVMDDGPDTSPAPDPVPEPDPVATAEDEAIAEAADRDPEEIIASAADDLEDTTTIFDGTVLPPQDRSLTEPVAPLQDDGAGRISDAVRASRNASVALDDTAQREFSARGARMPARDATDESGSPDTGHAADLALSDTDVVDEPAPAGQNPLAERLSRVRDASKARPAKGGKPVIPPGRDARAAPERKGRLSGLTAAPFPGSTTAADPRTDAPQGLGGRFGAFLGRGNRSDDAERVAPSLSRDAGPTSTSSPGRLTALGEALRTTRGDDDTTSVMDPSGSVPAATDTGPGDDENLTGGLLGRKPDEPVGSSFRTGLFLTIILLILLAAIAVWSALFLPDSPVARLFGGGSDVALEDPLDAPDAPFAITAPPAIGELADVDAPPGALLDEPVADTALEDVQVEDEAAADGIDIAAASVPEGSVPLPADDGADTAAIETPAEADAVTDTLAEDVPAIPPLPPMPVDDIPSLEETEAVYAEYQIWQRPPDRPDLAPIDSLSDLSLSARDPAVTSLDAISLPVPALDPSETFRSVPPPPPFGAEIETDAAGLVAATAEGVITPDGVLVTAGPPPVTAIPRPREEAATPRTPTFSIEDAILGTFRPAPRPGDLGQVDPDPGPQDVPTITRASLGPQPRTLPGRTRTRSAAARPPPPRSSPRRRRRRRRPRRPRPAQPPSHAPSSRPRVPPTWPPSSPARCVLPATRHRRPSSKPPPLRPPPRSRPTRTWPAPRRRATSCACARST